VGLEPDAAQFRERDGVYGDAGKLDGILLPAGATKMMSRSHVNSCAVCHNTPYRDGGAGANIPKNGGEGRNTPHMYGTGVIEMIGLQMRLLALSLVDTNRDGWVSLRRRAAAAASCTICPRRGRRPRRGGYGTFEDADLDGKPDLNPVFNPIYVDKNGKRIAFANNLRFPGVAGYTFEVQCYGFGHLYMPFRPPVSTTLRSFIATPYDIHSGMQAFDPTTLNDPDGDGFARFNAGAQQCVTAVGKDRARCAVRPASARNDPDRDGYCEELTEGDLDMAEWYLMNHRSRPGRRSPTRCGRGELFRSIGCATCHVPDCYLFAHDPNAKDYTKRYDGDRRFFNLDAAWNEKTERLEGKIVSLADRKGELTIRGASRSRCAISTAI
jgi:hypothetical protein